MSQSKAVYYNDNNGIGYSKPGDNSEKSRLHQQQPVKLHPAWEENNLPDDELNFKHITMADASLAANEPPDRWNLVYWTFLMHGFGILVAWNMFINAFGYFIFFKLSKDYIGYEYEHNANFMQYLTFCSQIPAVIFSWLNIFVRMGGSVNIRIVWGIGVCIVVFIITILMAMIDTSKIADAFFYLTLILVIILNIANAIYQNSVYGMAAKLPFKYTGALILGNNICGTFAAVVSILSKMFTDNLKMAAIYYFITALFILLICFDTYFALPLMKYYRHYDLKDKKEQQKANAAAGGQEKPPYWEIFKKCFPQLANVFCIFFVCLAVFPAIQVGIQKGDKDFFVSDSYYEDIMCFLNFNVFAMIGSFIPTYWIWPAPQYLWIPVALRFIYIPLFLMCNYQVEGVKRILPVWITNDWVYCVLSATQALTSGYYSSLAMMYAPGYVEERHATIAGMYAAAALVTGIFIGIVITFMWPWFIGHVGA